MSAARTGSESVSSIFNAITSVFTSAATGFEVMGDAASVGRVKSRDWLKDAQERSAAKGVKRSVVIATETALDTAKRLAATNKELDKAPELKDSYNAILLEITAAMKAATGGEESNVQSNS